jgi:hypothetical protein
VTRLADEAMGFKAGGARTPVEADGVTPVPVGAPTASTANGDSNAAPDGSPSAPPAPPPPPLRPPFTPASGD